MKWVFPLLLILVAPAYAALPVDYSELSYCPNVIKELSVRRDLAEPELKDILFNIYEELQINSSFDCCEYSIDNQCEAKAAAFYEARSRPERWSIFWRVVGFIDVLLGFAIAGFATLHARHLVAVKRAANSFLAGMLLLMVLFKPLISLFVPDQFFLVINTGYMQLAGLLAILLSLATSFAVIHWHARRHAVLPTVLLGLVYFILLLKILSYTLFRFF